MILHSGAPMTDQPPASRNRKLLIVLAAAGIFLLGFQTGNTFSRLYPTWSAPAPAYPLRVAVVDDDGSLAAARIKSALEAVDQLDVSERPDQSAARKDLAVNKFVVLVHIGPNFKTRVGELDFYDLFNVREGRLSGRLASLDIQIEYGKGYAKVSEIVENLVFSLAQQTIAGEVLKKHPNIAKKLIERTHPNDNRAGPPFEPAQPPTQGETP
jgi:hypothetical protein